jgi:GAF domain-containing protein
MSWLNKATDWFLRILVSDLAFSVGLRWLIACGILLRPIILGEFGGWRFIIWMILFALFLTYSIIATALVRYPSVTQKRGWHGVQVVVDLIFITCFYALTDLPSSDFFLFYSLPLLIAGQRLRASHVLLVFASVTVIFIVTLLVLVVHQHPDQTLVVGFSTFARYFLPRWMFFLFVLSLVFMRGTIYKRQAEELEAVRMTAISIANNEALQPRLTAIIDAAISNLNATGCAIYLRIPDRDAAQVVALRGVESNIFVVGYTLEAGMVGEVFRTKQPLIENDYPNSKYRVEELTSLFSAVIECPLMYAGDVIGIIAVYHDTSREFQDTDRERLEKLAQHVTVPIHDIQLVEQKRELAKQKEKQADVLEILNDAGKKMTASWKTDQTCQAIAEHVAKLALAFHADPPLFTSVALLSEDRQTLNIAACDPQEKTERVISKMAEVEAVHPQSGIVWRSIMSGRSELVGNVRQDDDFVEVFATASTELAVPILGRDEVIGAINIEHSSVDAYSELFKDYVQGLAAHAGAVLTNDIQFQASEEQLRSEEALRQASLAISSARGVANVAKSILDNLELLIPHVASALYSGADGDRLLAKRLSKRHATSLLFQNASAVNNDDSRFQKIQLKFADDVIAVIAIEGLPEAGRGQENLLNLFSNHAASVLQNAFLLEQNEDQINELREKRERLEMVLEHWEAHYNLAMIGLVFGESIHFAGNELGMAKAIARKSIDHRYENDEELKGYLEEIIGNIDKYMDVLRRFQGEVTAPAGTQLNLHKLLEDALAMKRRSSEIEVVRNYRATNPIIWAPTQQLRQVFLVILQNAITALNGMGTLTLGTKTMRSEGQNFIEVTIADTGPGILPRVQSALFKLKPIPRGKRGLQLGLPWAYSFLRMSGGELSYRTSDSGTTFTIKIPLDWRRTRVDLRGQEHLT